MTCYIVVSKPHGDQISWMIEGWVHGKNKDEAKSKAIKYLPTDWIELYPFVRLEEDAQLDAIQRGDLAQRYGGLTYWQKYPESESELEAS